MFKTIWELIRDSGREWVDDGAPRLGAALAFYSSLSLAPLLVLVVAVAGLVFGAEAASGRLVHQMEGMVGKEGAAVMQTLIANASDPGSGILAISVGMLTLLFGASGVFGELQSAMNVVWDVKPIPGRGLLGILRLRILSFAMVLCTGALLLVSLLLSAGLTATANHFHHMLPMPAWLLRLAESGISIGVITVMFALMFKYLPDVKIAWTDVWVGALLTAVLFSVGKFAIGFYLGRSGTMSIYGAAGSLMVLLLWIWYSTQILFFGAEFTQVWANRFGGGIEPAEGAMREENCAEEKRIPSDNSAYKGAHSSMAGS